MVNIFKIIVNVILMHDHQILNTDIFIIAIIIIILIAINSIIITTRIIRE